MSFCFFPYSLCVLKVLIDIQVAIQFVQLFHYIQHVKVLLEISANIITQKGPKAVALH